MLSIYDWRLKLKFTSEQTAVSVTLSANGSKGIILKVTEHVEVLRAQSVTVNVLVDKLLTPSVSPESSQLKNVSSRLKVTATPQLSEDPAPSAFTSAGDNVYCPIALRVTVTLPIGQTAVGAMLSSTVYV